MVASRRDAIAWAWELLTVVWKLDPTRLHVTVFEGDEKARLELAGIVREHVVIANIADDCPRIFGPAIAGEKKAEQQCRAAIVRIGRPGDLQQLDGQIGIRIAAQVEPEGHDKIAERFCRRVDRLLEAFPALQPRFGGQAVEAHLIDDYKRMLAVTCALQAIGKGEPQTIPANGCLAQ